jgi:hypothetical protein
MFENSFVERLLLATVGLYPKKKKVALRNKKIQSV